MADGNLPGYNTNFNVRREYEVDPSAGYSQPQYGPNGYSSSETPHYHQNTASPSARNVPQSIPFFPAPASSDVNSAWQYQNFGVPAYGPDSHHFVPTATVPYANVPQYPSVFGLRFRQEGHISADHVNQYAASIHSQPNANAPFRHHPSTDDENRETAMGALTPIETTPRRTAGRGMTSPSPSFQLREPPGQQVACQWCGKILTGPHAPGNLTRHQKSKECVSDRQRKEYTCSVEGCGRKYARSDGLRNHERKVHNAPGPARRNVPESPFRTDSNSGYVGHRLDDHPPGWPDL